MPFKCYDCGHIFEEGEESHWRESRGEFWGSSCSEEMSGCPNCRGDYGKTIDCSVCGSAHLEDELDGCVCQSCIEKYSKNIDMCFKIGGGDTEDVKINCFLASMFEKKEIEDLLFDELKKRNKYMRVYVEAGCERFVESDRSWFGERLAEELEKEKK